jgi:hypothetical protein
VSIRKYDKDHLREHAGVSLAAPVKLVAPETDDPLVFWTQHEKEPCEVNLNPFSTGQDKSRHKQGGGRRFIPFTGRPELIRQLMPAIEEILSYAAIKTVDVYMSTLRNWWRVLDAVEEAAATAGQPMARVEDVGLLTMIHSDFAHRSGISRHLFSNFRFLVDTTRLALGARQTYWESPEDPDVQKHIPPQEQRNAVRFAVRSTCRKVLQGWEQSDRLSQSETKPENPQEVNLWRNVRYMRKIQRETGKLLPTTKDLHDDIPRWALHTRGNFKLTLRESVFPSHWDAAAVWHQCLLITGWNSSTLTNLDATRKFLFDHFKDAPNDSHKRYVLSAVTYELMGEKARAGGKEQFVTGQWKSLDGPGHLIKTYLERIEPLRNILKEQLAQEKLKYEDMKDVDYEVRTAQFAKVKSLEQGCRSVWLYIDRRGKVNWLNYKSNGSGTVNGEQVTFLDEVVHLLNSQRTAAHVRRTENREGLIATLAPVPHVAAKDFRVWFADYVYRSSNGNMLHVKRALNHARLDTSSRYTDTNILNQMASDAARRFLNILAGELDVGRVDLTILAHLYRYGIVTPEQERSLAQLRALPKSRTKVACKDALHPPAHLKATANEPCDVQRCMLCLEHAVLLPESLDGIAMRAEELRALQGFLPIETWIEDRYDIELKNNLAALLKFDLNLVLATRKKWAQAIACGDHHMPGLPLGSFPEQLELV